MYYSYFLFVEATISIYFIFYYALASSDTEWGRDSSQS